MPVYNRAHLVSQAIISILDQKYANFEFVIVDDHSNDNTWQILNQYKKKDDRIKLFRLERHQGLIAALTEGNNQCRGRWIVKQDSDDVSLPDRLEVIERYNFNDVNDFFYHGMYHIYQDEENPAITRRILVPAIKICKKDILKAQYIPGCFAYKKYLIKEIPYRSLRCSEDWMLILDVFFKGKRIGYTSEALYEYIQRDDSHSLMNENTGAYEEDEQVMKTILKKEYGIADFTYAKRS